MTTKSVPAVTDEITTGKYEQTGGAYNPSIHHNPPLRQVGKNPRQVRTLETPLYVPSDLENIAQWVCWRYAVVNDKTTKIPVNVHTGGNAATNNPATWATFETAETYYHEHGTYVSGVGVVLRGTALVGVDLDHCIGDDKTIAPWALAIVRSLASYTEVSPCLLYTSPSPRD